MNYVLNNPWFLHVSQLPQRTIQWKTPNVENIFIETPNLNHLLIRSSRIEQLVQISSEPSTTATTTAAAAARSNSVCRDGDECSDDVCIERFPSWDGPLLLALHVPRPAWILSRHGHAYASTRPYTRYVVFLLIMVAERGLEGLDIHSTQPPNPWTTKCTIISSCQSRIWNLFLWTQENGVLWE